MSDKRQKKTATGADHPAAANENGKAGRFSKTGLYSTGWLSATAVRP